jgi:hypothetical protein
MKEQPPIQLFLHGINLLYLSQLDRLCGLVVRVHGHIQRSGLDSRRYQIFREVMGLERGTLTLMSTIELLGGKSSGSGLENLTIWP